MIMTGMISSPAGPLYSSTLSFLSFTIYFSPLYFLNSFGTYLFYFSTIYFFGFYLGRQEGTFLNIFVLHLDFRAVGDLYICCIGVFFTLEFDYYFFTRS